MRSLGVVETEILAYTGPGIPAVHLSLRHAVADVWLVEVEGGAVSIVPQFAEEVLHVRRHHQMWSLSSQLVSLLPIHLEANGLHFGVQRVDVEPDSAS